MARSALPKAAGRFLRAFFEPGPKLQLSNCLACFSFLVCLLVEFFPRDLGSACVLSLARAIGLFGSPPSQADSNRIEFDLEVEAGAGVKLIVRVAACERVKYEAEAARLKAGSLVAD